jgi:hypothetical protein
MSHPTAHVSEFAETLPLSRICTSIRGKLQFMDYLVRAAVADYERYEAETDPGAKIFLRQLIEMHASNLAIEAENMRLVSEFCNTLEVAVAPRDEDETEVRP